MNTAGTVQRAFDLARTGTFGTVEETRAQLRTEDHFYVEEHLRGLTVRRQLKAAIRDARQPHKP